MCLCVCVLHAMFALRLALAAPLLLLSLDVANGAPNNASVDHINIALVRRYDRNVRVLRCRGERGLRGRRRASS